MDSDLCIPQNILAQHAVVLGKTGAGKSSALRTPRGEIKLTPGVFA